MSVLIIWECETQETSGLKKRIGAFLSRGRNAARHDTERGANALNTDSRTVSTSTRQCRTNFGRPWPSVFPTFTATSPPGRPASRT